MHLSQLKAIDPKAYQAYVDMLIEDCTDEFEIVHGTISAYTPRPRLPPTVQVWNPTAQDGSWEFVE
jgi:hypothetical protein